MVIRNMKKIRYLSFWAETAKLQFLHVQKLAGSAYVLKVEFLAPRCFWTVALEKTLKSPLDCKEIHLVHLKGDQSWVFIGRIDVEAETPIPWPPHEKSWLIGKDPDAGRNWGQEEKGTTEEEMVGWHHRLNGHGFGWTPGVGDGQGGLAHCGSWGCKESYTTERLNWTDVKRSSSGHSHIPG